MGIPAYPIMTGDEEEDARRLSEYRKLCRENIQPGDLPHLPENFPSDHLPEFSGSHVILPETDEDEE